ncbi:MAG TPA: hypothetical protein VEA92_00420 [Candidatus Paceibacterota bacterium]|nr:hypothetical protein [Candidatus Paceibacterota bacterium]
MRGPDLDRERSERKLSQAEFLRMYNDGLPEQFPRASTSLLNTFSKKYPQLFVGGNEWTLDIHRKRVMDWLPAHLRASEQVS